jgi:WD40 repeat protein
MKVSAVFLILAAGLLITSGCSDNSTMPPGNGNNYESPPLPPEDLSALPLSRYEIQLTWKDRSDNEEGFHIFESIENDSSYAQIVTVGANEITYKMDGKRIDSLDYYYKVRSYNKFGNSAYTNVALVSGSAMSGEVYVGLSPLTCIDYDPTGMYILVGSGDYKVYKYFARELEVAQTLEMHEAALKSVAYSPDSIRFASSDGDGVIRVWNKTLNRVEYVFATYSVGGGEAWKIQFSPNSQYLAAGPELVNIWDLTTGEHYDQISVNNANLDVRSFAWHPGGRYIIIAGSGMIQIWETGDYDTPVCSFDLPFTTPIPLHLAVTPDGKYIVGGKSVMDIWEIKGQGSSLYIEHLMTKDEFNGGHEGSIYGFDFSYNGMYLATYSNDDKIKVWDTNTFDNIATIDAHETAVYGVAFSPDGMHMASVGGDGKIKIWLTFF